MWELPVLIQADNSIFKEVTGLVTSYSCNDSTRSLLLHYATLIVITSMSLTSLKRKTVTPVALQMALLLIFL